MDARARDTDLPLSAVEIIDALCDSFEKEWADGREPVFEEWLVRVEEAYRPQLAFELLCVEFELLGDRVATIDRAAYAMRAPDYLDAIVDAYRASLNSRKDRPRESHRSTAHESGTHLSIRNLAGRMSAGDFDANRTRVDRTLANPAELGTHSIPVMPGSYIPTEPGTELGKYTLLEVLGCGGFGVVWKAHDPDLDRFVAIKVPFLNPHDPEMERFTREGRVLARLEHQNIVRIHSVERTKQFVYIVTAFVEGVSLAKALNASSSLDFRASVELCVALADALQAAHDSGVVHRDVKPANILLDKEGNPHLTDFGLSKQIDVDPGLTQAGHIFGTPSYMSPEQARGEGNNADGRTDVYSMGVVLYQLLTGDLPFRGSVQVVLESVIKNEPASPASLDPSIPKDLETICLKCLEKAPDARYLSAADLRDDLKRWLDGIPIQARPVSRLEHVLRWCRREPKLASLSATIALITVVAFATVTWLWRSSVASEQARRIDRIELLMKAKPEDAGMVVEELRGLSDARVEKRLRALRDSSDLTPTQKLRIDEVLSANDPARQEALLQQFMDVPVEELSLLRRMLGQVSSVNVERLWSRMETQDATEEERLRTAAVLCALTPNDDRWEGVASELTQATIATDSLAVTKWAELLLPLRDYLRPALEQAMALHGSPHASNAVMMAVRHFSDDPKQLGQFATRVAPADIPLVMGALRSHGDAGSNGLREIVGRAADVQSERTIDDAEALVAAKLGVGLWLLGDFQSAQKLFPPGQSGALRHGAIHFPLQAGIDPSLLVTMLRAAKDPFERSGFLLILGTYPKEIFDGRVLEEAVSLASQCFEIDPDPGVHSAAEWCLKRIAGDAKIHELRDGLVSREPIGERRWYLHPEGITFLIFPKAAIRGSGLPEFLAVSATEITVEQLLRCEPNHPSKLQARGDLTTSAGLVSVEDALRYCQWLSDQEKSEPVADSTNANTKETQDSIDQRYRLPADDEWDYLARSGTKLRSFAGEDGAAILEYAWLAEKSAAAMKPPGALKPNPFGLFDILGNADEWTAANPAVSAIAKLVLSNSPNTAERWMLRGQNYLTPVSQTRIDFQSLRSAKERLRTYGFRVARSIRQR